MKRNNGWISNRIQGAAYMANKHVEKTDKYVDEVCEEINFTTNGPLQVQKYLTTYSFMWKEFVDPSRCAACDCVVCLCGEDNE